MIRFSTKANPERMQKWGDKFQNYEELELRRVHCLLDMGKNGERKSNMVPKFLTWALEYALILEGEETWKGQLGGESSRDEEFWDTLNFRCLRDVEMDVSS